MLKEMIIELYDYNYWANALILKQATRLSQDQFTKPTKYSAGSLRGTLVHTLYGHSPGDIDFIVYLRTKGTRD